MTEAEKMNVELDSAEKENMYNALMQIWTIMPLDVQNRFKNEQKCLMCNNCKEYLTDLQRQIRQDKMLKAAERERKESDDKETNII